ncbi:MAG: hypothetical protein EPN50_10525, partial [Chloroflexota bacterium]
MLLAGLLATVSVAPVAAVVVPAPALVQAQGLSDTHVEVLWSPVAGALSYDVYRGVDHVGVAVTSTLFEDTGLTGATSYSYTVTATTGGGTSAPSATATATTQIDPDTTAPTFNAGSLTTSNVTSDSVTLTWPHAIDNVGVVGFRILRGEDPASPVDIATVDVGLTYTASSLKAGTAYTFEVQAIDAADNASAPLSVAVSTPAATDMAPNQVSGPSIRVTPFSDTRMDITWGIPASDATHSPAVGYQILRNSSLIGEVDEPASPWFSDTGLTATTTYTYTIVALSSAGNAATPSAAKNGTTLAANTVKIVRGPYVEWITADSARVAWWTNIASPAVVDYGTTGLTSSASDATAVQEHVILLAGLSAGTAYQYTVGDGTVASSVAHFSTAAAPGTSFSFDAMGDYGAGSVGQTQNAGRIAGDTASFVQTLGDNIYSEAKDPNFSTTYSEVDGHFFKQMQPVFSAKGLFTANGNKEYYGHGAWFKLIWAPNNEKWYSYDWGDAHIVVLDSSQPFDASSAQYAWAQADLTAHQSATWRIVVIQDPPYSSTSSASSAEGVQQALVPLFEAQHVQLVLSGNSHNYERSFPLIGGAPAAGGVTYIVSGNGGNGHNPFTIAEPAWSAFRDATDYGYLHISVSPTAISLTEISAADGSTLDSAIIQSGTPATYHALSAPVRIVDSRVALGLATKLTNGTPKSFQVTGTAGIPTGATAITGNLTVTA